MSRKLLITGASGFVGYHLILQAIEKGFDVTAGIRRTSDISHLTGLPLSFAYLDFGNTYKMTRYFTEHKYDYIIHAAGATKAPTLDKYMEANALQTRNFIQAISDSKTALKKFIHVSSLAANGPGVNPSDVISVKSPLRPVTSYGVSKAEAEKYVMESGLDYLIFRPTAVYGPREKDLLILFKSISNHLETYIGNGEQKLSFIYVKDLATLLIDALDSVHSHKTYLVSDGFVYDKYELASLTKKILNKRTFKMHVPLGVVKLIAGTLEKVYALRNASPALNKEKIAELTATSWVCWINEAVNDFDFKPKYNLEQGLNETLNWYKEHKWIN